VFWIHRSSAELFGKIIIAELFVPDKYKTIKPIPQLGGYAGGKIQSL
jgi:hypothetical protein